MTNPSGSLLPPEPPKQREAGNEVWRRPAFWIGMIVVAGIIAAGSESGDLVAGGGMLVGLVALYLLPAIIARGKHNASSVFVINLFLGWTFVGWIIALAMAVNNPPPVQQVQQIPIGQQAVARAQANPERICPYCAEEIRLAAVVCKHCGRELAPPD